MRRLKIVLVLTSLLAVRIILSFFDVKTPVNSGVVTSEPRVVGSQQRFNIEGYPVIAYAGASVHFGDKVVLKKGVVEILEESRTGLFWKTAAAIRSKVLATYQSVLPRAEADLLSGIVLGSVGLDRNFKSKLASAGLTHVVAASGMNVSLFAAAVLWLLGWLRIKRHIKLVLAMLLIFLYMSLTGFEPPIVRAGLMAESMFIGMILGRQTSGIAGLLVAAYIMLWASPDLITNPSFLLSFTSMTGQIFLSTIKVEVPNQIAPIIAVLLQSFVAILFTLPIVLIFFASFSPVALFTNVLVLWTVEPLMLLGGVISTIGLFFTPVSHLLALPAQGLLAFFLWVVDTFSRFNFLKVSFRFTQNSTALLFVLGYYLLLGSTILFLKNKVPRFSTSNREGQGD